MKAPFILNHEAQANTLKNLECYIQEMRQSPASNASGVESNRNKIRLYLAETLQKFVRERVCDYQYYYQGFIRMYEDYQRADPIFFMDDAFEVLVKLPLEKEVRL